MKTNNHADKRRSAALPSSPRLGSLLALAAVCGLGGLPAAATAQMEPPLDPSMQPVRRNADSEIPRRDRVFLNKAHVSGQKEIALAQVAVGSSNVQVQAFARELLADHEKMGRELAVLAQKRGIALDQRDEHPERKLKDKSGKDFDEDFIKVVREEHDDAVELFEEAVGDTKDPEIREFAMRHLATLRAHLVKATQLKQALD